MERGKAKVLNGGRLKYGAGEGWNMEWGKARLFPIFLGQRGRADGNTLHNGDRKSGATGGLQSIQSKIPS